MLPLCRWLGDPPTSHKRNSGRKAIWEGRRTGRRGQWTPGTMDNNPSKPAAKLPNALGYKPRDAATERPDDRLLSPSIFGPSSPAPGAFAPRAQVNASPSLKLVVKGLKPIERQLLEGLVKVSQRRTPRLEILSSTQATDADVIVVDARDPAAVAWAKRQPWIESRAVIWIDGTEAPAGHTLLRRPVQWP